MKDIVHQAQSLRASGHTRRWHTLLHTGHSQTVAEHSSQAVTLLLLLHPSPSVSLIKAMNWHDTAERYVGDVPAPVRRANPEFAAIYEAMEEDFHQTQHPAVWSALGDLTEDDLVWLKAIDVLELLMHTYDLTMLGNKHAEIISRRAAGYLMRDGTPDVVKQFVAELAGNWDRSFA